MYCSDVVSVEIWAVDLFVAVPFLQNEDVGRDVLLRDVLWDKLCGYGGAVVFVVVEERSVTLK